MREKVVVAAVVALASSFARAQSGALIQLQGLSGVEVLPAVALPAAKPVGATLPSGVTLEGRSYTRTTNPPAQAPHLPTFVHELQFLKDKMVDSMQGTQGMEPKVFPYSVQGDQIIVQRDRRVSRYRLSLDLNTLTNLDSGQVYALATATPYAHFRPNRIQEYRDAGWTIVTDGHLNRSLHAVIRSNKKGQFIVVEKLWNRPANPARNLLINELRDLRHALESYLATHPRVPNQHAYRELLRRLPR